MAVALVADNDPGVRALLGDLTRRAGFEVLLAADGGEARERLALGGVDLLVCDLDMPGLSGQQLLAWLSSLAAAPQVLVVSGYVDAAIERELATYPFVQGVLRKPFDVMAFVVRLRGLARVSPAAALPQPESPDPAPTVLPAAGEVPELRRGGPAPPDPAGEAGAGAAAAPTEP